MLKRFIQTSIPRLLIGFLIANASLKAEVSTSELPVLTGTEVVTLASESVGDDFVLYVRLPPEAKADPERTFPVIYVLDGDHTFPLMASVATQLGWMGSVPPVIIVGVGYGTLDLENGNHRSRDLSPQSLKMYPESGGGPTFFSFLIDEAMPYVESNFPANPENRYLFGHSLGGLFSLYAYLKDPEVFTGVIAGSPYLEGQLDFLASVANEHSSERENRLFIVSGGDEGKVEFLDELEPLENSLKGGWAAPETYDIVILPGFDHFTMVAPSISMGLKSVFAK